MKTAAVRKKFLDYFAGRAHQILPSDSLVPGNDPSLLFTNAGMVQFKDVFLGREQPPCPRAATAQRCVRAGGKHNDLENVGYTARHHTFFEMLGNFSFGDYFKREAIGYVWEFLLQELNLPPERLWVTVYEQDDEAADIWLKEIGVAPERFSRHGDKDNFWAMGDTGPCGPCSEIFYDHGSEVPGGPPGSDGQELDRYVEIWNLVFMQFARDEAGQLSPLPNPSVDTGMGLERIAAVLQGVHSNYQTDLFVSLMAAIARVTGSNEQDNASLRVIADHIRSAAFLVADHVFPANMGRGYVLRRIIRRALRHGYKLGCHEPFFHKLVDPLIDAMGSAACGELVQARERVEQVLLLEEQQFAQTLLQGLGILDEALEGLAPGAMIAGDLAFKLYDTYGFPVDLTADIGRERELGLDMAGFDAAMAEQRERARSTSKFNGDQVQVLEIGGQAEFLGYRELDSEAEVVALLRDGALVQEACEGDEVQVVLDRTPFYAEAGGQVGDSGRLHSRDLEIAISDTGKGGDQYLHRGRVLRGRVRCGMRLEAEVDAARRQAIVLNHSATHLLHAALRDELGDGVVQKGSLVDEKHLRFDFSHTESVSPEALHRIEAMVNEQIRANTEARVEVMPIAEAQSRGAIALFGEKYGEEVRVLTLGQRGDDEAYSVEFCGGTHVARSGDIGLFKIVAESGVASGVRRIEALTGAVALDWCAAGLTRLDELAGQLKAPRDELSARVVQLLETNKALERRIARLEQSHSQIAGSNLAADAEPVGDLQLVVARLEGDTRSLRSVLDQLRAELGRCAIVLAAVNGEKVSLVAGVSKDATDSLHAGHLVNYVARQLGGKGGGRPEIAEAGGGDPSRLDAALALVRDYVAERVG